MEPDWSFQAGTSSKNTKHPVATWVVPVGIASRLGLSLKTQNVHGNVGGSFPGCQIRLEQISAMWAISYPPGDTKMMVCTSASTASSSVTSCCKKPVGLSFVLRVPFSDLLCGFEGKPKDRREIPNANLLTVSSEQARGHMKVWNSGNTS